mgnify:CR=1 FL=1|jgi:hypothetical protein
MKIQEVFGKDNDSSKLDISKRSFSEGKPKEVLKMEEEK